MVQLVDPEAIEKLHEKFVELDTSKDGKIQFHEIKKKLFDWEGGEAIIDTLKGADINRDGTIGYEEFMLALTDANFLINTKNM